MHERDPNRRNPFIDPSKLPNVVRRPPRTGSPDLVRLPRRNENTSGPFQNGATPARQSTHDLSPRPNIHPNQAADGGISPNPNQIAFDLSPQPNVQSVQAEDGGISAQQNVNAANLSQNTRFVSERASNFAAVFNQFVDEHGDIEHGNAAQGDAGQNDDAAQVNLNVDLAEIDDVPDANLMADPGNLNIDGEIDGAIGGEDNGAVAVGGVIDNGGFGDNPQQLRNEVNAFIEAMGRRVPRPNPAVQRIADVLNVSDQPPQPVNSYFVTIVRPCYRMYIFVDFIEPS